MVDGMLFPVHAVGNLARGDGGSHDAASRDDAAGYDQERLQGLIALSARIGRIDALG